MMNFVAKTLVLIHTVLSIAAMAWALSLFLTGKDFGWNEPRKEVLEYTSEGEPKSWVRHASTYDKSTITLDNAVKMRNLAWVYVKPALEAMHEKEPYLYTNHLHYLAELKRLRESPDAIAVMRLKDGGLFVEIPTVGRPIPDDTKKIDQVSKSLKVYAEELKKLEKDIKKVEDEITIQLGETKKFTAELTGTDEANKYVHPGLYQLADREFKTQSQLKIEIDEIKPYWSQAIEQARQYRIRRTDLEATLSKLKAAAPKTPKKL